MGSKFIGQLFIFSGIFWLQRVKVWRFLFLELEVIKWICFLLEVWNRQNSGIETHFWKRTSEVNIPLSFFNSFFTFLFMWATAESFQNSNLLITSKFVQVTFFAVFQSFFKQSQTIPLTGYYPSVFNFFLSRLLPNYLKFCF